MMIEKYWGFDECSDKKSLFKRLDKLQESGKIFYKKTDGWTFLLEDLELEESEIDELLSFFEDMDVYPSDVYNDEDDEDNEWISDDWD